MTQDQIEHTLFPVGDLNKTEIREIAEKNLLINADKPDSQDICFIPDGDYAKFITDNAGEQYEGDIILSDGTVLGKHKGSDQLYYRTAKRHWCFLFRAFICN